VRLPERIHSSKLKALHSASLTISVDPAIMPRVEVPSVILVLSLTLAVPLRLKLRCQHGSILGIRIERTEPGVEAALIPGLLHAGLSQILGV
jgi:hypothetical protein